MSSNRRPNTQEAQSSSSAVTQEGVAWERSIVAQVQERIKEQAQNALEQDGNQLEAEFLWAMLAATVEIDQARVSAAQAATSAGGTVLTKQIISTGWQRACEARQAIVANQIASKVQDIKKQLESHAIRAATDLESAMMSGSEHVQDPTVESIAVGCAYIQAQLQIALASVCASIQYGKGIKAIGRDFSQWEAALGMIADAETHVYPIPQIFILQSLEERYGIERYISAKTIAEQSTIAQTMAEAVYRIKCLTERAKKDAHDLRQWYRLADNGFCLKHQAGRPIDTEKILWITMIKTEAAEVLAEAAEKAAFTIETQYIAIQAKLANQRIQFAITQAEDALRQVTFHAKNMADSMAGIKARITQTESAVTLHAEKMKIQLIRQTAINNMQPLVMHAMSVKKTVAMHYQQAQAALNTVNQEMQARTTAAGVLQTSRVQLSPVRSVAQCLEMLQGETNRATDAAKQAQEMARKIEFYAKSALPHLDTAKSALQEICPLSSMAQLMNALEVDSTQVQVTADPRNATMNDQNLNQEPAAAALEVVLPGARPTTQTPDGVSARRAGFGNQG